MPYTAPTVNYATTMDGTYTTLTGVQSVTFNRGRQRFIDPFAATSCTIELIPANSYATPLAVGQYVDIRPTNSSASPAYFVGKISDVQRTYGIPYNSGTGAAPADRIRITVLGPIGLIGRDSLYDADFYVVETGTTPYTLFTQNTARWFNIKSDIAVGGRRFTGCQWNDATDNPLTIFNQIAATEPFYFSDRDNARVVISNPSGNASYFGFGPTDFQMFIVGQGAETTDRFNFSDAGGGFKYNAIEYGTGAQNTFTQVNVVTDNADGVTNVATYSTQTGFAPYASLDWHSYGTTAAEAKTLGDYLLQRLSVNTPVPFSITTSTAVDDTIVDLAKMNTVIPGTRGTVTFRGQTFRVTLEGLSVSFYPDRANVTAYFSPWPLNYFVLDSTINGVLDTNVLA